MGDYICQVVNNKEDFLEMLKDLVNKSKKIIITNIHKGNFEYILPKEPKKPKRKEKGKQSTLEGEIVTNLTENAYYRLGSVILPEFVFKGDKDYKMGLEPVFPYSMLTILWKTEESENKWDKANGIEQPEEVDPEESDSNKEEIYEDEEGII